MTEQTHNPEITGYLHSYYQEALMCMTKGGRACDNSHTIYLYHEALTYALVDKLETWFVDVTKRQASWGLFAYNHRFRTMWHKVDEIKGRIRAIQGQVARGEMAPRSYRDERENAGKRWKNKRG